MQPVCISIKGRKPYPTMNTAFYSVTKWGLPKLECSQELWVQALKIQYGNGAAVVVRVRESRIHGEGRQVILLIIEWRYAKCKKLKRYYQY